MNRYQNESHPISTVTEYSISNERNSMPYDMCTRNLTRFSKEQADTP